MCVAIIYTSRLQAIWLYSQQVIDEIDGALGEGKGAVEVILKMVRDDFGLLHLIYFMCVYG